MKRFGKIILGMCMMTMAFSGWANELVLSGRSAQDAFKDQRVVELLAAVIGHNVSEAKRLVANGANVNAVGEGGITPLLWVEFNKDTDAMQLLLDLGADPNEYVLQGIGETGFGPPLWMAAAAGQTKACEILLNNGADPNLAIGGKSPLMRAIGGPHLDCADLLLQHGADINYPANKYSLTAFDMGIMILQYDVVLWVLNHGYTHDLERARLAIVRERRKTRPGQEAMKEQALEMINSLIAAKQKH